MASRRARLVRNPDLKAWELETPEISAQVRHMLNAADTVDTDAANIVGWNALHAEYEAYMNEVNKPQQFQARVHNPGLDLKGGGDSKLKQATIFGLKGVQASGFTVGAIIAPPVTKAKGRKGKQAAVPMRFKKSLLPKAPQLISTSELPSDLLESSSLSSSSTTSDTTASAATTRTTEAAVSDSLFLPRVSDEFRTHLVEEEDAAPAFAVQIQSWQSLQPQPPPPPPPPKPKAVNEHFAVVATFYNNHQLVLFRRYDAARKVSYKLLSISVETDDVKVVPVDEKEATRMMIGWHPANDYQQSLEAFLRDLAQDKSDLPANFEGDASLPPPVAAPQAYAPRAMIEEDEDDEEMLPALESTSDIAHQMEIDDIEQERQPLQELDDDEGMSDGEQEIEQEQPQLQPLLTIDHNEAMSALSAVPAVPAPVHVPDHAIFRHMMHRAAEKTKAKSKWSISADKKNKRSMLTKKRTAEEAELLDQRLRNDNQQANVGNKFKYRTTAQLAQLIEKAEKAEEIEAAATAAKPKPTNKAKEELDALISGLGGDDQGAATASATEEVAASKDVPADMSWRPIQRPLELETVPDKPSRKPISLEELEATTVTYAQLRDRTGLESVPKHLLPKTRDECPIAFEKPVRVQIKHIDYIEQKACVWDACYENRGTFEHNLKIRTHDIPPPGRDKAGAWNNFHGKNRKNLWLRRGAAAAAAAQGGEDAQPAAGEFDVGYEPHERIGEDRAAAADDDQPRRPMRPAREKPPPLTWYECSDVQKWIDPEHRVGTEHLDDDVLGASAVPVHLIGKAPVIRITCQTEHDGPTPDAEKKYTSGVIFAHGFRPYFWARVPDELWKAAVAGGSEEMQQLFAQPDGVRRLYVMYRRLFPLDTSQTSVPGAPHLADIYKKMPVAPHLIAKWEAEADAIASDTDKVKAVFDQWTDATNHIDQLCTVVRRSLNHMLSIEIRRVQAEYEANGRKYMPDMDEYHDVLVARVEVMLRESVMFYKSTKRSPFFKITMMLPRLVSLARTVLERRLQLPGAAPGKMVHGLLVGNQRYPLELFEANVPYVNRFMMDKHMRGDGWMTIMGKHYEIRRESQPVSLQTYEFHTHFRCVHTCDHSAKENAYSAPTSILSLDGEMDGKNGFPVPGTRTVRFGYQRKLLKEIGPNDDPSRFECIRKVKVRHKNGTITETEKGYPLGTLKELTWRDKIRDYEIIRTEVIPGDECVLVCGTFHDGIGQRKRENILGPKAGEHFYRFAICRRGSRSIPGVDTYHVADETEAFEVLGKLMRALNPLVISGYNTDNFDLPYFFTRGQELGCASILFCGSYLEPIRMQQKMFQSAATQTRINNEVTIPGRLCLDMLRWAQKNKQFESNTLNFVAGKELKSTKEDVHHSLIPRLFAGGPDEVTRLIKYCVTDCVLPLALDDKWQAYAGGVEMARVTGVLHESLISRGQGEKSDSLFIRECAREDLLRPIRTPYSRDDGPQHFFTLDVEDCAWEDENDNDDGEAGEPQKQRQTVYNLRDTEDAMDVDASTLTVRHDIDQRRKRPLDELADQPPAKRQRTTGLSSDASSATAASSANAQPSTAAAAATLEMGRETVSGDASARKRKRPSSDSGEDAFSKPAKLRKVAIGSTYELTEEDRRFGYEHVPDAELARRKQFAGATVKEPDKGFYHENAKDPRFRGCIVTNDFSSLYPSVMIAFNLWQIQNAYTTHLDPEEIASVPYKDRRFIPHNVTVVDDNIDPREDFEPWRFDPDHPNYNPDPEDPYGLKLGSWFIRPTIKRKKKTIKFRETVLPDGTVEREILPDDTKIQKGDGIKTEEVWAEPELDPEINRYRRDGILPRILVDLLAARKRAKKLMEEAEENQDWDMYRVFDAQQLAFKVTCNSLYGFTGGFRLRDTCIASAVTRKGRELLQFATRLVENHFSAANYPGGWYNDNGLDAHVVYGDTDSIMINFGVLDWERSIDLGREAEKLLDEAFAPIKPIRMPFEKVFARYLLRTKKRYAGIKYEKKACEEKDGKPHPKLMVKGFENVRRSTCREVRRILDKMLDIMIMQGDVDKAYAYGKQQVILLLEGKVDISRLVMTASLSKNEYATPPAVYVMKERMIREKRDPSTIPKVGNRVSYLYTAGKIKGSNATKLGDMIELPEYVFQHNIPINYEAYLEKQYRNPMCGMMLEVDGADCPEESRMWRMINEAQIEAHKAVRVSAASKIGNYVSYVPRCINRRCAAEIPDKNGKLLNIPFGRPNEERKKRFESMRVKWFTAQHLEVRYQNDDECRERFETTLDSCMQSAYIDGSMDRALFPEYYPAVPALCKKCQANPLMRINHHLETMEEIRRLEAEQASAWSWCQRCVASNYQPDRCNNNDCELYYRRKTVGKELDAQRYIMDRLDAIDF